MPSAICTVVDGALTPAECRTLIDIAEAQGFSSAATAYPPSYRDNTRQLRDDPALAAHLLARLRPLLPPTLPGTTPDSPPETLQALNTRFRLCRYRDGQQFTVHQDGAWHPSAQARSRLTLMLYLNGPDEFTGGDTRFYVRPGGPIWRRVQPQTGRLVLFGHDLWHDGAPVHSGQKYILRTDVIYADAAASASTGHQGYSWCALRRRDGRVATGGRDRSICHWRGDVLEGQQTDAHALSVLALAEDAQGRLWSGSRDGTLRCWPGPTWTVPGGAAVLCLHTHDGQVISGDAGGQVLRWTAPGQGTVLGRHGGWVRALATDAAGMLLSGGEDGAVYAWPSGARLWQADAGVQVWSLAVTPEGRVLAGLSDGHIAVLGGGGAWRAHAAGVRALAVDARGRLWSGGEDSVIRCWGADGRRLLQAASGGSVSAIVAAGDGGEVVVVGYGGHQRLGQEASTSAMTRSGSGLKTSPVWVQSTST